MTKASFLSLTMAIVLLAACGIKPAAVDPPQGEEKDYFPRTYPDPSPDPNPQRYLPPR